MTLVTNGAIQSDDGVMIAHAHPVGEVCEDIGDQQPGEPCVWCARGVPRYDSIDFQDDGKVLLEKR